EEKKNYLMRERRVCSFKRTFSLPKNIAYDKVSALFKDGLLTITLPKSEDTQEKVISIKRG
ncbi:MAG TPA: Hsp20 family protein, partial [Spirochaetales bacterium]|nr:Hsp20 family protein [Spirochaetales bacterium]